MAPLAPTAVSISVSGSGYSVTWSGSANAATSWQIHIYYSTTQSGTYNLLSTNVVNTASVTGYTASVSDTPTNSYWYLATVKALAPQVALESSTSLCTPVQYSSGPLPPVVSTTNVTMSCISTVFGGGLSLASYKNYTNFEPCAYGILSTNATMGYFRGQSVLQPPTSVTLASLSATGGTLSWTAPSVGSLAGYIYSIGTTAGGTNITNLSTFNSSSPLTFAATLTGNTNYYAVMKTKNSGGGISFYSAASAAASFAVAVVKTFNSATPGGTENSLSGVGTNTLYVYGHNNCASSYGIFTGTYTNTGIGNIDWAVAGNCVGTSTFTLIINGITVVSAVNVSSGDAGTVTGQSGTNVSYVAYVQFTSCCTSATSYFSLILS